MKVRRSLFLLLALAAFIGAAWVSMLIIAPPARTLDQRVYEVASQVKCPVCQNESAADSSASIAEQMRLVIRQQLQAGMSEQQILRYFAAHYGEQILLTPPQQGFNLLAWVMPVAIFLLGLLLVSLVVHDWRVKGRMQLAASGEQEGRELLLDADIENYRALLEQELAEDDALFDRPARKIE
jgi:cytochrome c-type biogenesis protein CcmH